MVALVESTHFAPGEAILSSEVRTVASLALLYAFRMLGLFMVLPILVLYGQDYQGATPFLLGLALGVYGLSQALFQIPLGLLSDVVGRKPVIVGGLVLFAVGSVVAATSSSVEGLILGRFMQGAGAIASAIMALVADLTSEKNRTKAMAASGASIGLSFSLAMILGPGIAAVGGLAGVFFLSAGLAVIGIVIVYRLVPTPVRANSHRDSGAIPVLLLSTAKNLQLLRLNFGIFSLHAILMACFVALPEFLESELSLARSDHWKVYLPTMLLAFVIMLPLMMLAEKKHQVKFAFLSAVFVLALATYGLSQVPISIGTVVALVFVFFIAFNLLEALLPSLVSKLSPAGAKGTAMGLYSTCQFLGAFIGGATGGWLLETQGISAVFIFCSGLIALWLLVAAFMSPPKYLTSLCLEVGEQFADVRSVLAVQGVEEALHEPADALLYLKVDKRILDEFHLRQVTGCD